VRKRYPAAALIFAAAVAGKGTGTLDDWPAVALVVLAAVTLVGVHVYDGISAGPVEVDGSE